MAAIDSTTTYTPNPEVMTSRVGGELVLLHVESGVYFGIDPVGTVVWESLKLGQTPAQIIATIGAEYADVPPEMSEQVTGFLQDLLDREIIVPA